MTKADRAKIIRDRIRERLGKTRWVAQPSNRPDRSLIERRPEGPRPHNGYSIWFPKETIDSVRITARKARPKLTKNQAGDQNPISRIARAIYDWNGMDWRFGP